MIKKLYCPWDLTFFGPKMKAKFNLEYYSPKSDKKEPVVVFGCYGRGTKADIMNNQSLIVIVWSGSDSVRLHEDTDFVRHCIANKERIFHIAHSHWIQTDLKHWNLEYIDRVVLPVDLSRFQFEPQVGTKVYHYGSHQRQWYYGTHLMKKLRTKWDKSSRLPNVEITNAGGYSQDELYEIYKDCFVGVRLTEHDNMALSCIELGLMGRKSIFNGNIPCAIPYGQNYFSYDPQTRKRWVYQDESLLGKVAELILSQDREPDKNLAEEMREFVYDDKKWLNTEFYD
jgi:hypothetical protein